MISLLRLTVADRSAIAENLWAEDGLFALCVRKNGIAACVLEPYGGSFQTFLPKVLAGIVAVFTMTIWAVAANILSAAVAGLVVGLLCWILRDTVKSHLVAILLSFIPVLHVSLRSESINSYANTYIVVGYLCCLIFLFPGAATNFSSRSLRALAFLSVITLSTLFVVIAIAAALEIRRHIDIRRWSAVIVGSLAGLCVQILVATQDTSGRQFEIGQTGITDWLVGTPANVIEAVTGPGRIVSQIENWSLSNIYRFALPVVVLLVAICFAGFRGRPQWRAAAALTMAGLLLSAIPSIGFGAIDRYFVWQQLLIAAATVCLVWGLKVKPLPLVALALIIFGWTTTVGFSATEFRASNNYSRRTSLQQAIERCGSDGARSTRIYFAPVWPTAVVMESHLTKTMNNEINCSESE